MSIKSMLRFTFLKYSKKLLLYSRNNLPFYALPGKLFLLFCLFALLSWSVALLRDFQLEE